MKKISFLLMSLIAVISLTGCGGKTVTCTLNGDGETTKMVATFKGDKMTKIVNEATYEGEAEEIDSSYAMIEMVKSMFGEQEGLKISTSKTTNSVSMKMELDLTKIDEETMDTIGFDSEEAKMSAEEFVESMTAEGYTCK